MPTVSPLIVLLVELEPVFATDVVKVEPPSVETSIRYPVMVDPPLETGADQVRAALWLPAVAERDLGAVGTTATAEAVKLCEALAAASAGVQLSLVPR